MHEIESGAAVDGVRFNIRPTAFGRTLPIRGHISAEHVAAGSFDHDDHASGILNIHRTWTLAPPAPSLAGLARHPQPGAGRGRSRLQLLTVQLGSSPQTPLSSTVTPPSPALPGTCSCWGSGTTFSA